MRHTNFIDKLGRANRQWFKANIGLPGVTETSRDASFCAHEMQQGVSMEVEDATQDKRFSANPLVTGDPEIRFYAGVPLALTSGQSVGALCLIDHKPRKLTQHQRDVGSVPAKGRNAT